MLTVLLGFIIIFSMFGGFFVAYKTNGFRQLPGMQKKALGSSLKSKDKPLFAPDLVGGKEHPIYNITNPFSRTESYREYNAWITAISRYKEFRRYKLWLRIRAVYLATKNTEVKTKAELVFTNQLPEADAMFSRIYDIDRTAAQTGLREHLDLIEKNVEALERGELATFAIESNTFKTYVASTIEGTIVPSALDLTGVTYQALAKAFQPKAIEAVEAKKVETNAEIEHYERVKAEANRRIKQYELGGHLILIPGEQKTIKHANEMIQSIRKRAK